MVGEKHDVKTTITLYFDDGALFALKRGSILGIGSQKVFGELTGGVIDSKLNKDTGNRWTLVFSHRMSLKKAKKFPEKVERELKDIIQNQPMVTVSGANVKIECEEEKTVFEV